MRRLSAKYSRQLRLFVTRNSQGCDIVISGFDGFLTNVPRIDQYAWDQGYILEAEGDQPDLGLIIYSNEEEFR
jgi:hypothetical protein